MKLNLPHLTYQRIGEIADQFLSKYHPKLSLPIPIEQIAESKLNLKIFEQIDLKKDYDVDSFLTSDLSTIFIDFNIYANVENRTRCSIAHEIGHLILHGELLRKQKINSKDELGKFLDSIDDDDYGWFEYQAYSFASQVLVPKKLLISQIKQRMGYLPDKTALETLSSIAQDLLEIFQVSGDLMLRRLEKEGVVLSNRK